jgi:hypothetical protein
MREDHNKGASRFSMDSLIGDRFLKKFYRSRSNRRRINPANVAGSSMENEGDQLSDPGNLLGEGPLEKEATLENKKTGEANKLSGPEDGSIQPENDQ